MEHVLPRVHGTSTIQKRLSTRRVHSHRYEGLVRSEGNGHEKDPIFKAGVLVGGVDETPAIGVGWAVDGVEEIGVLLGADDEHEAE